MDVAKKSQRRKIIYTIASVDGTAHIYGRGFDPEQIYILEAALAISGEDFRRIHRKRNLEPGVATTDVAAPKDARVIRKIYNNGDFVDCI